MVISVKECLAHGWKTFRARPWLFISAGLVLLLINILVNLAQSLVEQGAEGWSGGAIMAVAAIALAVLGMAISFLVSMGETAFFLKAEREVEATALRDLWHPRPFWKFVGAAILAGLIIVFGLVLLIVPGIIASVMLMFVSYLVIDRGLGPVEALKESARLTKGNRWKLFLLALAVAGVNLLGLLALVAGLLVSIPVSFLAVAHAYRLLSAKGEATAPVEAPLAASAA